MRKVIYLVVILFCFGTGFMNLDSNDWKPVELPGYLSGDEGGRVLPIENWEENLVGEWDFYARIGTSTWQGKAIYNADKAFVKKLSYTFEKGGDEYKSGGTFRGTWSMENEILYEVKKTCNFSPAYEVCNSLGDTIAYGKLDSDLWEYEVPYFNEEKIEIRGRHLSGTGEIIYRFTRI